MRITLERAELVQLIGKSLGYVIADEDIEIRAEPFEVSIRNVDLSGMSQPKKVAPEEPEEEEPEEKTAAASVLTMNEILNQNAVRGGPKPPRIVVEDSDIPLHRSLGPLESEDPPPVTQEELAAGLRGRG